jgi:hypothetical protein
MKSQRSCVKEYTEYSRHSLARCGSAQALDVTGGESLTWFGEDRVVDEIIRPISVIADEVCGIHPIHRLVFPGRESKGVKCDRDRASTLHARGSLVKNWAYYGKISLNRMARCTTSASIRA